MRNDARRGLRAIRPVAERSTVTLATLAEPRDWWTWRLSAHFRMASMGSVWVLVFLAPLLGPLLAPLAVLRFAASSAQLYLNTTLGRRQPVGSRDWIDWTMLVLALAGSIVAAAVDDAYQTGYTWWLLLPVIVPFSMIQLRMGLRCYRAAASPVAVAPASVSATPAPIPLAVSRQKAA